MENFPQKKRNYPLSKTVKNEGLSSDTKIVYKNKKFIKQLINSGLLNLVTSEEAPNPEEVQAARLSSGLSISDAAKLIYVSRLRWVKYEQGSVLMPRIYLNLYMKKVTLKQVGLPHKPTARRVRKAREKLAISVEDAGKIINISERKWSKFEVPGAVNRMSMQLWEWFLLETGLYEDYLSETPEISYKHYSGVLSRNDS